VGFAVADSPPKLNVGPSCNAAARGALSLGRNAEACMGDERAAQELANNSRAHETQCVGMTTSCGLASYVQLISCSKTQPESKKRTVSLVILGRIQRGPNDRCSNRISARPCDLDSHAASRFAPLMLLK
jgi:hypothetical protein